MCGRFSSATGIGVDELLEELGLAPVALAPRYNVAPTQDAPVVRARRDRRRELVHLRWGLVPSWASDASGGAKMINARAESVAERPAFREALRRRRCGVVADGFYEWKKLPGGRKQPYRVTLPGGRPFLFAGLWERWGPRESRLETFTIVTCPPTPAVAALHDRMPVILASDARDPWLDPDVDDPEILATVLRPYPGDLAVTPVSTAVNRADNDVPDCIAPISLPPQKEEPAQASLPFD